MELNGKIVKVKFASQELTVRRHGSDIKSHCWFLGIPAIVIP